MTTKYPFRLPDHLICRLPAPASDGSCDIDIMVNGSWDGILVSKSDGFCVGVRVRGRVREYELPFDDSQIEDVRPACLSNRVLSAVAFGVYEGSLSGVMIVSPVLLILAHFVWRPLSAVAVVICVASICGMYARRGFPFLRPLATVFGVAQVLHGVGEFLVWLKKGG